MGCGVHIQGMCPGSQRVQWYDYGGTYQDNPGGWQITGAGGGTEGEVLQNGTNGCQLKLRVALDSGPVPDGNGSPVWTLHVSTYW